MNILITGASKGIGFDTALELAESNENRILAISRSEEGLKRLSESAKHSNISIRAGDINELTKRPEKLYKMVTGTFGRLDILINNAAYLVSGPFHEYTDLDTDLLIATNFSSPLKIIRTLISLMHKGGHVINIGSMAGFQGSTKYPGISVYSATKAAISSLTECLAAEYRDKGISFNCLGFGAVQTEMLDLAFPGYKAPINSASMASFVAWFACNGQKYFNGKILPVSTNTP